LFEHKNFRQFMMQMYMKIEFEMRFAHAATFTVEQDGNINLKRDTASWHYYYIYKNLPVDVNIVQVINGDYEVEKLYPFMNDEEYDG